MITNFEKYLGQVTTIRQNIYFADFSLYPDIPEGKVC